MTSFDDLPVEICEKILFFVPLKDRIRLRRTNKLFSLLIPDFSSLVFAFSMNKSILASERLSILIEGRNFTVWKKYSDEIIEQISFSPIDNKTCYISGNNIDKIILSLTDDEMYLHRLGKNTYSIYFPSNSNMISFLEYLLLLNYDNGHYYADTRIDFDRSFLSPTNEEVLSETSVKNHQLIKVLNYNNDLSEFLSLSK